MKQIVAKLDIPYHIDEKPSIGLSKIGKSILDIIKHQKDYNFDSMRIEPKLEESKLTINFYGVKNEAKIHNQS